MRSMIPTKMRLHFCSIDEVDRRHFLSAHLYVALQRKCLSAKMIIAMAIYHFTAKVIKRSDGRSSVKAAAYRHATKMFDEKLGDSHNYSYKRNVIHCEVMVPHDAPEWAQSLRSSSDDGFEEAHIASEKLWNKVEEYEKRKDSQLAREFEFSLPVELNQKQNLELAREFIKDQFVKRGMMADFAIHWEDGNPHVHVMLTMRELTEEGFGLKVRADVKSKSFELNWNSRQFLNELRAKWAEYANFHLRQHGHDIKIDHRSFADQGIDLVPGIHEGVGARKMQQLGMELERVTQNDSIKEHNHAHIQKNPEALIDKLSKAHDSFDDLRLVKEVNRYVPDSYRIDTSAYASDELDNNLSASKAEVGEFVKGLQKTYATFSDAEIGKVVNENTDSNSEFINLVARIKGHQDVIYLGLGEDGRDRYTTRSRYRQEANMIDQAERLSKSFKHGVDATTVEQKIKEYGLNESQAKALKATVYGGDATLVIGRAGTGKTYMMKAAREIWEASGYKVHGVALSGIAAEGLEEDAGIRSNTIHSFKYQVEKGYLKLGTKDIIVMDEAGMTDSDDMANIVNSISSFGSKLSVIGDLEQTQSIGAGSGLKSLMSAIGFTEMGEMLRQKVAEHRIATGQLAQAETSKALDYYHTAGHIHFSESKTQSSQGLIESWASHITKDNLPGSIILAHQNESVHQLNALARNHVLQQGWVTDEQTLKLKGKSFKVGLNERLLFLQNNKALGVKNGSFGTVTGISDGRLTVKLDNGKSVSFTPSEYDAITYGYAATVHKTQGVTKDHVFVQIDGHGWDRHLIYVALSRHKYDVQVFASQDLHRDLGELKYDLSRYGIKDAIIDYPLAYAVRRGFDGDRAAERAALQISFKDRIQDAWLFITNYQAYLERVKDREHDFAQMTQDREAARKVAAFADLSRVVRGEFRQIREESQDKPVWEHPKFSQWQEKQITLNALGASIYEESEVLANAIERNRIRPAVLERAFNAHQRLLNVKAVVDHFGQAHQLNVAKAAFAISQDRKGHYSFLSRLASENNIDTKALNQRITDLARRYQYFKANDKERGVLKALDKFELYRIEAGKAWAKATAPTTPLTQRQKYIDIASQVSLKRDRFAAQVKANWEQAEQFTSLYRVDTDKLAHYAKRFERYKFVERYINEERPTHRAYMARFIQDNIKQYYPAIKSLQLDKAALRKDYYRHEYLTTLKGLQPEERKAYELLHRYNERRIDAARAWKAFKATDNIQFKHQAEHYFTQRNQAAQALNTYLYQEKLNSFTKQFKVDANQIHRQAKDYTAAQKVSGYLSSANVRERDYLAAQILDSKAARKFIYQKGIDFKELYRQREANKRRQSLVELTPQERQIWRTVDRFEQSAKATKVAWAKYFEAKKQGAINPGQYEFCKALSKTRDAIAYDIALDAKSYAPYLAASGIKGQALEKYAIAHSKEVAKSQGIQVQLERHTPVEVKSIGRAVKRYDYDLISNTLTANTEEAYKAIFGEPKSQNSREMRYPGGLIVTLKGSNRGAWHDFSGSGALSGGGPVQAIQYQYGCDFKTALEQAASIAGIGATESQQITLEPKVVRVPKEDNSEEVAKRIKAAQYYFDSAKPAAGSLAEKYLITHRGIEADLSEVRFHPRIKDPSSGVYYPGLVVAAKNKDGVITASQTIVLDADTVNKADVEVVKRTRGVVSGSAALLQNGSGSKVYLAEGPETGLSIASADPTASVYITLGNFKNAEHLGWIADKHQTKDIYIAADNDGKVSRIDKTVSEVAEKLYHEHGIRCYKATPDLPGKNKCDFNDVLKSEGLEVLKAQLSNAKLIPVRERKEYRSETEIKAALVEAAPDIYKEKVIDTYRSGDEIILSDQTAKSLAEYQTIQASIKAKGKVELEDVRGLQAVGKSIMADKYINDFDNQRKVQGVSKDLKVKGNKLSQSDLEDVVAEVKSIKVDDITLQMVDQLFELEQQYKETSIDRFNSLGDKSREQTIEAKLQDINAEERALLAEIKNNAKRWESLSTQAEKSMLARMKQKDIQQALRSGKVDSKMLGEALEAINKVDRRIGFTTNRSKSRSEGRSR